MSAPRPAFTPLQRRRVLVLAGVVPLAIAVGGVALMVSWLPELPERLATHWNATGAPDGHGSLWMLATIVLGVAALLAIVFTGTAMTLTADASPVRARILVATSVAVTTAITVGITAATGAQRGGAPAPDGGAVGAALLAGLGIGVVLGASAWSLTPRWVQADADAYPQPEPIELAPEERAVWSRTVAPGRRFTLLFGAGLVLVLGIGVASVVGSDPSAWPALIAPAVVVVLAASTLRWRVTVSRTGIVTRSALGLPRFVVPVEAIESVRVTPVHPLAQFGGWGLRWGSGRRFGVVITTGEGIEVRRTDGSAFVVTVADAATGAALLAGFVARAGSRRA
jgi:MFS family permease